MISGIIIALLALGIGIFQIITNIKEKEREELERQNLIKEEINTNYNIFNELATKFNEQKQELNNTLSQLYYQTIPEKNEEITNLLDVYSDIIKSLKETSLKLEKVCPNEFTDSDLKRKCASYKISLENAINVYQEDILSYNNLIEEYNKWIKTQEGYLEILKYENEIKE